jgi:hypothetical protein
LQRAQRGCPFGVGLRRFFVPHEGQAAIALIASSVPAGVQCRRGRSRGNSSRPDVDAYDAYRSRAS